MVKANIEEVCDRIKSTDSWVCYQCQEELFKFEKLNEQIDEIGAKLKNNITQGHSANFGNTSECSYSSAKRPRLEPTAENTHPPITVSA